MFVWEDCVLPRALTADFSDLAGAPGSASRSTSEVTNMQLPIAYSIADACVATSCGRTTIYQGL
jgi:hypothetical protein